MKRQLIMIVISLLLMPTADGHAEIKNAYTDKLKLANNSLKCIDRLLQIHITGEVAESKKSIRVILRRRRKILKERKEINKKYLWTRNLLEKFRAVDPQLYNEIDSIKDRDGNETDVYVKVVDQKEFSDPELRGSTNLATSEHSNDIYHSAYGDGSVSVKIANASEYKQLMILAHEFGHVRYQVPNLSSYLTYFDHVYSNRSYPVPVKGHLKGDPSSQSVMITLKEYKKSLVSYIKQRKNHKQNTSTPKMANIKQ